MSAQLLLPFLILVSVVLNTGAQTLLKLGAGQASQLNLYLLGGIGLYGLSTIFYILVLGKVKLSIAYPLVIGLTIIATTIVSVLRLHERVSLVQWTGVALIVMGICAIAGSKSS
jgi:multidrug transporter EmrE-like cation transporter